MRHICCVALCALMAAGPGVVFADSQDQPPKRTHLGDTLIIRRIDPYSRGPANPSPAQPHDGAPSQGAATNVPPQPPRGAAPRGSAMKIPPESTASAGAH
jgi:hypothetical protein